MLKCDHCMLPVSERDVIRDNISGDDKVFCCKGCNGIYRMIRNEGLDDFYTKRHDWTPGPAEQIAIDEATFGDGIHPSGNELEVDIIVDGIRCASCVWLNEKVLLRTVGITHAQVNYATHRARIRWDPARIDIRTILSRITSIGYTPKPFQPSAREDEQKRQSRDLLMRFGTAGFFSMQLMLFSMALYAGYFQGMDDHLKLIFHMIAGALTLPVLFYAGWPIIRGAFQGLQNRVFNMDVLIAAGSLSAFGYSVYQIFRNGEVYFDTAAMIITLILLGRFIEAGAKSRASETISRLMQLSPKEARVLEIPEQDEPTSDRLLTASRRMAAVSTLVPGALIEIHPGEKIALDGMVIQGTSEVDEAMLTGESKPATKTVGSAVFCGTINRFGSIVVRITRVGRDTVLSQIIKAVEDAQGRRAPIQSFADRIVGWFVPTIIIIAAITFTGWLSHGAPMSVALMNAVSVLVIACPCALGLATPLAILIGTSNGAIRGILIKGGDVIEKTAGIQTVVFDKTGTITQGKPRLALYEGHGIDKEEALRIAASLERRSEHSLGQAITDAAGNRPLYPIDDFRVIPGHGVFGTLQGKKVLIGSRIFIERDGVQRELSKLLPAERLELLARQEKAGATIVYLSIEDAIAGSFVIADQIRPETAETVSRLRASGFSVAMITGDDAATASAIAGQAGIQDVMARISPVGKADEIARLEHAGRRVLMTGDGINDAPALARASVGVAMGRATDIAIESADIVIMRPDLRLVADALILGKTTFRVIRQNIFWAFFYNVVVIPLAMFGLLHPIVAAGSMAFSSLSVVGNSLRARLPK